MSPLAGISLITLWMGVVLILAVLARRRWPLQRELSRKIVHIGTGPVLPLAWWLEIPLALAAPIALAVSVLALINHRWRLLPAVEDVDRHSYGTVAYGLAITTLLVLFWPDQAQAACAGVLVMAAADGLAGLIGRALQTPQWQLWGQTKSIAGTLTMAVVSLGVLAGLAAFSPHHPDATGLVMISLLAVGLEQVSKWGIDNLSVPIGVALSWQWLSG